MDNAELINRITAQTYAITQRLNTAKDLETRATYQGMLEAHTFTLKILGVTDV